MVSIGIDYRGCPPWIRQDGAVPIASVNGVDLYYELRGTGPRLLLFNGSGTSIASSAPLIDRFAERFEVLVLDHRCLGASTIPREAPTMADWAADGAALLDHVGWETTCVFGISFGGMVALEFAVTWPERVVRLALACTSAGGGGGSSYPLHTIADLPADEQERLRLHLADSRYTPEFLATHPFDQMLVDLAAAGRAMPKSEEQLRGERLQLEGRRGHDVWDRLHNITCPTAIAYGEFDALAPPANSHALATRIAQHSLQGFQGGHGFLFQDRNAFPWVLDFLTQKA